MEKQIEGIGFYAKIILKEYFMNSKIIQINIYIYTYTYRTHES